jgi:hypothetical protein
MMYAFRIGVISPLEAAMRKIMIAGIVALAFSVASHAAVAQERILTGAAIGAGVGAVLAGPPGAVVGGVLGASVGGPRLYRRYQECWYDRAGMRHCRFY